MHHIDASAHHNRWSRRHPAQKAFPAFGFLLLSLVLPPLPASPLILLAVTAAALRGAGIPARVYFRTLAFPLLFAVAGVLPLAFNIGSHETGGYHFAFSQGGAALALRTLLRVAAATASLLFLSLTTPIADLAWLLGRCRLPAAVIEVMMLTYRMLWLVNDTAGQITLSQTARLGYSGLPNSYRSLGILAATLLGRTLRRARRLETGLAARGYQGDLRVLLDHEPLSLHSLFLAGLGLCLVSATAVYLHWRFAWMR